MAFLISKTIGLISFVLFLSSCSKINIESTKASLLHSAGQLKLSVTDVTAIEGNNLVFSVQLSASPRSPVSVDYATQNGSALAGLHYSSSSGTLTFNPGETVKTVTVSSSADPAALCSPDLSMVMNLSNASGASIIDSSGTGTISDPDVPSVSIVPTTGTEGANLTFTASLSGICSTKNVSFNWATSSGTASSGSDFNLINQTASIGMGLTSINLSVPTINDSVYEGTETFTVTLSSVVNGSIGTASATGTVLDDETIPVVNFSSASQSFNESGGSATVTVSLSHASTQSITVPFTVTGTAAGSGTDFTITASPVTIPAGSTSTTVSVAVVNDVLSELNETVILTLGTPTNATKGIVDVHTLTITDDDIATIANVTSAVANGTYTTGNVDISVTFTSNVTVTGTPLLNLNTTPARFASYFSGSGSSTLVFRYALQAGDYSADLDYASTSALVLSGGTITDTLKTTNATLTLPTPGTTGSLGLNKNIVINVPTIPSISSVTIPASQLYGTNEYLDFKFIFSENVVVTGTPVVALNIGGNSLNASYFSGSGTSNLVFRYVVGGGITGNTPVLTSPINLSGGTIKSSFGINATLTFTYPDTSGIYCDGRTITLSFNAMKAFIPESSGISSQFTLTLTAAPLVSLTIPLTFKGTAVQGTDYDIATSVVIPAGQTSVNLDYDVLDDSVDETSKYFTITADRPSVKNNLVLGEFYGARVSILDDDPVKDRWLKVSNGVDHSCGITTTNVLKCWGRNNYNQLGDNTSIDRMRPVIIDSGVSYKDVSAADQHACGITTTNELRCWGNNFWGQIGDGTNATRYVPKVIHPGISYKSVRAAGTHTCGITSADELYCWGANWYGVLGTGDTNGYNSPQLIDSGTTYKFIETGSNHTCGITTAGQLKCWGYNLYGQVGDGTTTGRTSPSAGDIGTVYNVVAVGSYHACGITNTNVLKCWGLNLDGQAAGVSGSTPLVVDAGVSYSYVSADGSTTCAFTTSNVLKCWGYNLQGQLGDGKLVNKGSPTIIDPGVSYKFIDNGAEHTCGITSQDLLKCWGSNTYGELGEGTPILTLSPFIPDTVTNYKHVVAGDYYSCGITSTDAVKCWGLNNYSQLGDGSTFNRSVPVLTASGQQFKTVDTGDAHSCGITNTDVLMCWGKNDYGQIGDNTTTTRSSPVVVDSGVTYKAISVGGSHTCGITSADVLKCWGKNGLYAVGDGTNTNRLIPTVISAGVAYKFISAGTNHSCGITSTDELRCWGVNFFYGQLGNGSSDLLSPGVIDAGTSYLAVSAGGDHTCGITLGGQAKCWGQGAGRLGDGTSNIRTTPVFVSDVATYKFIDAGRNGHTCGITTADVLKCWGSNSNGEMGDGTKTGSYVPVVIDSGVSYKTVGVGWDHTCAVTTGNVMKCWGNNYYGQLAKLLQTFYPVLSGDH